MSLLNRFVQKSRSAATPAWRCFTGAVHGALATLLFVASWPTSAASLAPVGCPLFHCTTEATGVIKQPVTTRPLQTNYNSTLGAMKGQGCSGDGAVLACLFATDTAAGQMKGTLKLIDATSLQPQWGTASAANSYNLDATSAANGQVPLMLSDGLIVAGDKSIEAVYNRSGAMVASMPLTGSGNNYGLTPISDMYGVVSQADGVLTLINMATWQAVGSLTLTDPQTRGRLGLVSPSSASASGVLYAVAANPANKKGYLFSVVYVPATGRLAVRSAFAFVGQSGASPVVVEPVVTGLQSITVLLHAPGLLSDSQLQDRLISLKDNGVSLSLMWMTLLPQPMKVSPAIDMGTRKAYVSFVGNPSLYQYDLLTGTGMNAFNLRAIGGFPSQFVLNGHVGATDYNGIFTLLLAGGVTGAPSGSGINGQYVLAFEPNAATPKVAWSMRTRPTADQYTAAWNLAPSARGQIYCPVVVGSQNGIIRVCDF